MVSTKKIMNIALKVATWLLVAFTVVMMLLTILSVTTVDKNDRSVFGIKFYIVQTDSMSPSENNAHMDVHFSAGDIILIKNVKDKNTLKAGDIIAFMSSNSVSYGETVTHMIREVKRTEDGKLIGFVTFGTNTGVDDEALVEPEYVLGAYSGKLAGVGKFFAFMKTTPGYIVCILVPFLLLILYNGVNVIRLFRKYKSEQTEILEAEKAQIAAEKKQNEEMMRELMALKAQLDKQNASAQSTQSATDEAPAPAEQPAEESAEETAEESEEEAVAETAEASEAEPIAEETSEKAEETSENN